MKEAGRKERGNPPRLLLVTGPEQPTGTLGIGADTGLHFRAQLPESGLMMRLWKFCKVRCHGRTPGLPPWVLHSVDSFCTELISTSSRVYYACFRLYALSLKFLLSCHIFFYFFGTHSNLCKCLIHCCENRCSSCTFKIRVKHSLLIFRRR